MDMVRRNGDIGRDDRVHTLLRKVISPRRFHVTVCKSSPVTNGSVHATRNQAFTELKETSATRREEKVVLRIIRATS